MKDPFYRLVMNRIKNQILKSNVLEVKILFVLNWKIPGECKFGQ